MKKMVDLNEISIIHTGTLCMTGAVAHEISKEFKMPFIVSVRNTDINTYFKIMWWKKKYFYSILKKASKVIFISPQYKKDCFDHHFNDLVINKIKNKTEVIPNGIDSFYLKNREIIPKKLNDPIELVFAGGFRNNKNLLRLIHAVEILKNKNYNIKLTAIGRSLPNRKVSEKYIDLLDKEADNKNYINLVDFKRKDELCKEYKNKDIFVMPSIHETFGLSYAEALTQGLPIIYTKDQGFDGFYEEGKVGFSVEAKNIENIAKGIENVVNNYQELAKNVVDLPLEESFDWVEIAKKYKNLYKTILLK